jgi:two-component system, LuxR family, sensor kinase FixL
VSAVAVNDVRNLEFCIQAADSNNLQLISKETLLRGHGVMTIFYVVVAALFVLLLVFLQFRRMRAPISVESSAADFELSRHTFNNYAFAVNEAAVTEDRTMETSQQDRRADLRQGAGIWPPRLSSRQSIHLRLAKLSWGRFRQASLENELRPCRVRAHTEPPDDSSAAARRLQPDEQCCRMLDLLPLAVLVTNSHRKIVFSNAAAEKLFGYSRQELAAMFADKLLPPLRLHAHVAGSTCFDLTAMGGNSHGDRDLVARRKDGTEFPAEVTMNPVSPEGEPCNLTTVIDRTERYELLQNRRQLAHLTRVSTLGELAGSLAHELNQPLTAILSNAQAAQRFLATQPLDLAEVREILHDLVEDNNRASEVIRKIRALVKKVEAEAAPLSIASVIRDVALLVHSDAIVRGIRVFATVAPELPPVHGDKVQLQQVLLNLLLNAFDASESCSALDHEVTIEATFDGADTIRVGVRDSGVGLAADTVDKIFLPFFTSKRDGLGLGLSISRSIVEMHKGRIWAENNKDRGATFYFTLPTGTSAQRPYSRREP